MSLVINAFIFYLEVGLETPPKRTEIGEKGSEKNFISSRDGPIRRTETRQE